MRSICPYFFHPLPLTAVVLTAANDHYFKLHYASALTGKLSDVTGLFFVPLFLCALLNLAKRAAASMGFETETTFLLTRKELLVAMFLTYLPFVLINTHDGSKLFYEGLLGGLNVLSRVTKDPSDLWAMAVGLFTYKFGSFYFDRQSKTILQTNSPSS